VQRTIEYYVKIIQGSGKIFVSGPVGVYENRNFTKRTKKIYEAIEKPKDYRVIRFTSAE
jgi:phosphoglycerate kinase